ncbi:16S rRNA (cytidine(1402)-2'-O)-methyltransferase [Effusibacillus dendaii]|uniref:Ribosomal RNA small subunit methyltransferase I n=1 Tax=Effusibacillus dendaii TaxID=2743772 RepID=A0A7I8DB73_9BACL|nr:16S rRNA (cytidine(1402)-2'-O)-methyltransferase [Effusibacillus dendaii]BCJ87433.1 ribosomal RNA small subunit methyltransferase I [Effusibacillus dendaii]
MEKKYSYRQTEEGKLYLVATPIGNLQDMTFRAVEVLRQASVIAAEDTRQTWKLLNHFEMEGPRLISYHEHNKPKAEKEILELLRQGQTVALVTDAGTPAISDPGEDLVRAVIDSGFPVISIPGACAAITALVASGLPTRQFSFVGFLPRERKHRIKELAYWKRRTETLIFYEAPHRIRETVEDLLAELGNRHISAARELTKRYEEFARGTLEEFKQLLDEQPAKGEYVLVVAGCSPEEAEVEEDVWWRGLSVSDHVDALIGQGIAKKDAIKQAAKQRGQSKRDVYQAVLQAEADEK